MNESTFWDLIDKAYQATEGNTEEQADWLIDSLMEMPVAELIDFHKLFLLQLDRVYRSDFQAICNYLLKDSDEERFDYFCAWLISLGRKNFKNILQNPDAIAAFLEKDEELNEYICESETMLYLADIAYEEQTGNEDFYDLFESEPVLMLKGETLSESDVLKRYPNIAKKIVV